MTESSGTAEQDRLTITHASVEGVSVVTVRGEIDHHTGGPLRRALTRPGSPGIVVDLSGVTFMDSSGINVLITAQHTALETQGWLRLAGPSPSVLRTMQLVGLDEVIAWYPTLREALDA
ncbi:STAS domain-containing protein [Streptomyces sp. NPDC085946]|uniref:STAS domain-containing protein n=1 Tax=Streptomyces sp. NPDC085946 TaxID=3365744 RepID=UPI0037D47E32